MMMKNLIKTLGFILALVGPSVAMAATDTNYTQSEVPLQKNIINQACIYWEGGEQCASVPVSSYACLSISGNKAFITSEDKEVTFTCKASNTTTGHDFKIDCGDGHSFTGRTNSSSFTRTCKYEEVGHYNVACYVDGYIPTNPACITTVGYKIPANPCGNSVVDSSIEQCDLGGKSGQMMPCTDETCSHLGEYPEDPSADTYYCLNCAIVHRGSFVFNPAECRYSDTPISVMNNEVVPYWWKLLDNDSQEITDDEDACKSYEGNKTLLLDDMECEFAVYNGLHNQTPDRHGYVHPINTIREKCLNFGKIYKNQKMLTYFEDNHDWDVEPDGLGRDIVQAITDNHSTGEFGEYKLVLQNVEFSVCDTSEGVGNGKRVRTGRYGAICEVNFAVTKPYVMQISTFGVNPIGTDGGSFLYDYYNIYGNNILTKTDLNSVIKTDNSDYAADSSVISKFDEFKKKYESLAVEVKPGIGSSRSMWNVLGLNSNDVSLKKVPNKSIYFIKKNNNGSVDTLVLSQDDIKSLTTAYTIIVEGMDVEIVGNVLQYAMIVTNQEMSFKDAGPEGSMGCASGGQVVQGIYVALSGFKAADEDLKNNLGDIEEKYWCPWGGLHVKGVLIGANIDKISKNKRSQLNSWFNAVIGTPKVVMKARRETIIKGASLLIEYSPSLWKTLPPGAEIFTEGLEIYRK